MPKFSAAFYSGWTDSNLRAEAEQLGVKSYGKNRRQLIDAIYNAELRRRQEDLERQDLEQRQNQAEDAGRPLVAVDANVAQPVLTGSDAKRAESSVPLRNADQAESQPDYDDLTVAELKDLADERGVDLGGASRKADIIQALRADDEAKG